LQVQGIPRELLTESARIFWDVDPLALDPVAHADFIIGRVLSKGSWSAIRALRAEIGDDVLRDFVQRAPHRLDARSLRFFQVALGTAESPCMTKPSRPSSAPLFSP
jgi:hypothetical protein